MKKIVASCSARSCEKMDLTYLISFLPDYDVMHGEDALERINNGEINPENVFVLQDRNSKAGRKLRKLGAVALVNFCFESEIYAGIYYSKLRSIAPKFKYRIYFKGMYDGLKNLEEKNNFIALYPGISVFKRPGKDWDKREFVSLVMGNKYYEQSNVFPRPTFKLDKYLKWIFRLFFETKTQKFLKENELQNKRLEFIEFFGQKGGLKMFGRGWDVLDEIPPKWQTKLEKIVKELNPQPLEDKLSTVANFKFNFAIENLRYKGYVTEKILESMVAGAIPVYLGAPDIEDFVPRGCFIDVRDFKTLDELYAYMKNMTAQEAQKYFDNASEFLNSDRAKKHTEEGFSEFLAKLVKDYDKN